MNEELHGLIDDFVKPIRGKDVPIPVSLMIIGDLIKRYGYSKVSRALVARSANEWWQMEILHEVLSLFDHYYLVYEFEIEWNYEVANAMC